MKDFLLRYYLCGAIKYLKNTDIEERLKSIGKDMANKIVLVYDFKIDNDVESLLFRITFDLLSIIYKTKRTIEKSEIKNVYYLIEQDPLFDLYNSSENICIESLFSGIIENILEFSGFSSKVTAHKYSGENKIVYEIQIIKHLYFEL